MTGISAVLSLYLISVSPVPGGMSTNITSTSPQTTSLQNCLTAPAITGPRQTTGSFGLSTSRFSDMTPMPLWLRQGNIPSPSEVARSAIPNATGIDGPVISASRIAVFSPRLAAATARSSVTRLLPTPPLPLMTATTRFMLERLLAGTLKSVPLLHEPSFFDAQSAQL